MVSPEKMNCSSSGMLAGCCRYELLHQRPIPVADLQHAEGAEIQTEMIRRRHVDHATGADEAFGALDLVAHLGLVGALCAPHGLDHDHQPVIHVAAEGR